MRPDPGGVFQSDEHRRVLANVGTPRTLDEVAAAVYTDPYTDLWPGEPGNHSHIEDVITELQGQGFIKKSDSNGRFEISKAGLEELQKPVPSEPPPIEGDRARQLQEEFVARERALLDQEAAREKERLRADHEAALEALDQNIKSHEETLKSLVEGDE